MKRWVLYIIVYALAALLGGNLFQGTDVAKLSPVEAVWVSAKAGQVQIETDMGDVGVGSNAKQALENMKATAQGQVFLETADYLIVERGNEGLISQLQEILRPTCGVCVAAEKPDLQQAAEFLNAHEPDVTMKKLKSREVILPILENKGGRLELVDKG